MVEEELLSPSEGPFCNEGLTVGLRDQDGAALDAVEEAKNVEELLKKGRSLPGGKELRLGPNEGAQLTGALLEFFPQGAVFNKVFADGLDQPGRLIERLGGPKRGLLQRIQKGGGRQAPSSALPLKRFKLGVGVVDLPSQDKLRVLSGNDHGDGEHMKVGRAAEKGRLPAVQRDLDLSSPLGPADLVAFGKGVNHAADWIFLAGLAEGPI